MTYNAQLSDEAINDYDEAVAWYEQQKNGLGFELSFQLAETLEQIENFPASFQSLYGNRHCAIVKKFPYKIFYIFDKQNPDIIVFAIIHDKRNPNLWHKRSINI